MSASDNAICDGTPSTTTPIAGPWLSPQVVKRNKVPKELPAMLSRGCVWFETSFGLHRSSPYHEVTPRWHFKRPHPEEACGPRRLEGRTVPVQRPSHHG